MISTLTQLPPQALTPEFVTRCESTSFMFWLEMFGIFSCSVSGTMFSKKGRIELSMRPFY